MLNESGVNIFRDIVLLGICIIVVYVVWNILALTFNKIVTEYVTYREYRERKKFVEHIEELQRAVR